jgi:hypothetical protein
MRKAARLGYRAHLEPMTQEHDRDQGRELPPDLDLEQAGVPAHDVTMMAIEMSVIIPGWQSLSSLAAPRRKTSPSWTKTIVPSTAGAYVTRGLFGSW